METMLLSINAPSSTPEFSDVIWIQTSFIGDIILSTAAMAALRAERPNLRQHLITTKLGAAALKGHPLLDSIHTFSKRDGLLSPLLRTTQSLKALRLNHPVIIQPHKSLRSTILSLSLGYPLITYKETAGSLLAWRTIPRVAVLHESDRITLLLEGLGVPRDRVLGTKPQLPTGALPQSAQSIDASIQWIGIAPGSVWGTKRWPATKFATLAQLILDLPETGLVLLGSPDETAIADVIDESCKRSRPTKADRIVNLCGKTSLLDLNGIYPRLAALISNDSSPIHYASAFNVPTIAIFGATVPSMGFGPLADQSDIAEVPLDCRPCGDHGPSVCPLGHFKCMNDLEVNEVLDKLKHALKTMQRKEF